MRRLRRGGGQNHGLERLVVHLPASAVGFNRRHTPPEPKRGARIGEPPRRRRGQRLGEAHARQQQIGRARAGKQRVFQHAQEHGATRLGGGGVERCHAQRLDQLLAHPSRQPRRQHRHRGRRVTAKPARGPAGSGGQQAKPFGHRPAPLPQHGSGEGRNRATGLQPEPGAARVGEMQRRAKKRRVGVDADGSHQRERVDVGADQDVLAVVEPLAVRVDTAGAPAELCGHLEERDAVTQARGFDRRGHARPPTTDDSDTFARRRGRRRPRH